MAEQDDLVRVLDEFSTAVVDDLDTRQVLERLADAARVLVGVDAAGVMVPGADGLVRLVFAHAGDADALARLQEELQEGPCLEAELTRRTVDVAHLTTQGRWPRWQHRAEQLGVQAVTSVPLLGRGRCWGVLDLYRHEARALTEPELLRVTRLARLATSYLVVAADRDDARRAREELAHRAMHDPLTDLPLRWVLEERLAAALARAERTRATVAVLFLDVDDLKPVNDTWGHAAGDELLRAVAARVSALLRTTDTVARVGGDEFVVLLEDVDGVAGAAEAARRISTRLGEPVQVAGRRLDPSVSTGVALSVAGATPAKVLLARADSAMYAAKRGGRGLVEVDDSAAPAATPPSGLAVATAPAAVGPTAAASPTTSAPTASAPPDPVVVSAADLRAALTDGRLELHYQPVLVLAPDSRSDGVTDGVAGRRGGAWSTGDGEAAVWAVEALLRWHHPSAGLLAAARFVDLAEQHGLLVGIGRWVLDEACRQLAAWDAELGPGTVPRVFVNASAGELADPGLLEAVAGALGRRDLDPARLTVEVTESGLLQEHARATLRGLEALGCGLAIDDLGAGWSSLGRVMDLPRATLKVDRSITAALVERPEASAVVSAVLLLGRSLGSPVVLEGVEDEATLAAARRLGARHVQGYLLGRPGPADALSARVLRGAAGG
ncbi:putative bifunctional diguanylate cyclase/phosphodiesterase [Cellulomonas marina]|uniref:Diguanylate cyclase (GGDEF) domain-containing protein n=1 Tax=Cellulomonas marina TaxID=988821 RepID=A0A1I0ZCP3_9CELL|nr:sensor domain-containing phosphodiesterase [Cellulomonas marina]GIG29006.1 hypothetical protein Cma02nite_16060 [Cellulomonas marina]SFB22320.1 diguanylate cyclase (GGDEF) domain-containing protein [Cellulomonas marina]